VKTFLGTDADAYKALARHWAASVNIVTAQRKPTDGTARDHLERDGFTATAFLTVSIDPPIVLVSVTNASSAAEILKSAASFAVNMLAHDQAELSASFARAQAERAALWDSIAWTEGQIGAPLLGGTLGAFEARVRELVPAGDHTLVLGDVVAIHHGAGEGTLLYHNRGYGGFHKHD
jgi:flavin reductase (DIM6/NTAB) family NADH-FMN oxidoreductase RutF